MTKHRKTTEDINGRPSSLGQIISSSDAGLVPSDLVGRSPVSVG
jgi:hypothetical protein